MGIIRGGLLVIICVLFFVGLLVGNLLFSVYGSLEHSRVKENLGSAIKSFAESEANSSQLISEDDINEIKSHCQSHSSYVINSSFSDLGINVDISCENASKGNEAVVNELVSETVDQLYYKKYNCSPSQCLEDKKTALYFVSEDFRKYLSSKVYLTFIVLLVFFALMLLLAKHKSNAFIIAGAILIAVSLPFMKLESVAASLIGGNFSAFSKVFLSDAYKIFIINLILGILLLIAGIVIKITGIGIKISEHFSKKKEGEVSDEKVEEIVKKEVAKAKKEEIKKQPQNQGKAKKK
ncbi:hypothetical protein HY212_04615 [Candidatus Pacearchaeota archaeon]|nr:hypothetical protein [Candidatus Pacearchaeota archaeon]